MYNYIFLRDIFESQLEKSLIGKMYFLRYSNFNKLKSAIRVNRYLETFRLDRDRFGKFDCQIIKGPWKDERIWSYDAKLMVYNFNDTPILTEELGITKESLRIKDMPKVNHKLFLRMTPVSVELIPRDLYNSLMKVSDKDIINFSIK